MKSYIKLFKDFTSSKSLVEMSKSTESKRLAQQKKQAKMDDDDPNAYKKLHGDVIGKKKLKTSKHTKNYHAKYTSKNESILEGAKGDRSAIGDKSIEKGLAKKSKETGVPIEYLRIIMRRGMAAWKSSHRPGATQEQWGYARVNSFLTKSVGTWGTPKNNPKSTGKTGVDSDVAREIIKKGYDSKLK